MDREASYHPAYPSLASLKTWLFSLLFLFFALPVRAEPPHILVLHSYHPELNWTADIMHGITSTLALSEEEVLLHAEYLDTQRNPDLDYLSEVVGTVFPAKLASRHFDLVITSDNDAFNFVRLHRHDLFANVPVVFCGVNGFDPDWLNDMAPMTGIAEEPAFAATIGTALRLHPARNHLIFIGETTSETGRRNIASIEALLPGLPQGTRVDFWLDQPLPTIKALIQHIGNTETLFLVSALRKGNGTILSFEQSAERLRALAPTPIYGFWDFFLGHGIIGGKLVSAEHQGRLAAQQALRILNGAPAVDLPVIKSAANRYLFDYNELQRFDVDSSLLPPGHQTYNLPTSFYQLNKWQFWAGVLINLLLIGCLLLLLRARYSNRLARHALEERSRLAALGAEVGRALTQGERLQDSLQACTEALLHLTGAALGRIWVVDEVDPELLILQASAGISTRLDGEHSRKKVGEMKVGILASSRQPLITNAVLGDPNFTDQEWIRRDGIVGFAGYPLVVQDRLVGVAAFFSRQWLTPEVQSAIASVADMIAVGIERSRSRQALTCALASSRQEQEKTAAILRSVADALLVIDEQQRLILMNRAAEELLQTCLTTEEPCRLDQLLPLSPLTRQLTELFIGESDVTQEIEIPSPTEGGASQIVQARMAEVLGSDGQESGRVILLRDITRERELDRMKNEFISVAAHELRTPLTSVIGYSELLLGDPQESLFSAAQRQEYLGYIMEKGELLEQIIDDLLDLGRIETGRRIILNPRPCEMVHLIKEVVQHHQQETQKHQFILDCPDKCVAIDVDQAKMLRVFDNLLSNAVKYSPQGGAIRISGGIDREWMTISIADGGLGMEEEQIQRAFDKFYRADMRNTAIGGLGLGLTICKGIVEAHGGKIWLESRLGEGTIVSFSLPISSP
ncbi:MAG: hypothetical protein C0621_01470 [Desulfuromonas sp.]|nr:MAG: hypothetical protein C0621_01470 [Desulfuromonas sp.]